MTMGNARGFTLQHTVIYSIAVLVCVYLVLPSLIVVPMSFNADDFIRFPPRGFSLRWYEAYFTREDWWGATLVSVTVAVIVTLLATALGVLAAYGLVRGRMPFRSVVILLLLLPMIVPSIVTALGLYGFFAPLGLVGTIPGLVLAHTVLALPFTVINAAAVMQRMDWRVEQAARSLGASATKAFFLVTLPLLRPGILAGAAFAFITSFDEVVVARFITGTRMVTLPVRMWNGLQFELNPVVASASTLLLMLSVLGAGIAFMLRGRKT